ncbi:polyprenyl synthetase family protein [Oceanobacillus saliphilus]|uniref:polyprenyl synthetase family protein n=1 Tax=Oceanobacillus saliphilus TaxID=2925834 RepID=UPI00201D877F|nr:polyprenyl synthetase family protein [Oceanobacillus saliphilus]
MNQELLKNADACYRFAEQQAAIYFESLSVQLSEQNYIPILTNDIHSWKHNHVKPSFIPLLWRKKKKLDKQDYSSYIQWLEHTGKLESYLDRSISYIFIRDLGKALDEPATQARIQRDVARLRKHVTESVAKSQQNKHETFSMVGLYRLAQKEGVESTLIWVMDKIKTVSLNIPSGMNAEEAQRKLIKIIAGVVMQVFEEMGDKLEPKERTEKLDKAIRLGYSYGLTYPFIDDLLDSKVLSRKEERQYSEMIRITLTTGTVPDMEEWTGDNRELMKYIHAELKDAFEFIKANQEQATWLSFLEQSYIFFKSQEVDRDKELSNETYSNEELYIPVIVKSASSRLIVRSIIRASEDKDIDNRTFFYGIYNQLADDFADMFEDLEEGRVTPYTYYLKHHDKRLDLINPFELYWTVISYLIHDVYHSDAKTCEIILDRAINGLKRYKNRMGIKTYNDVMEIFASFHQSFNHLIEQMVRKADDVDFFDKLLRDHMIKELINERKQQEEFLNVGKNIRMKINHILEIPKSNAEFLKNEPIIDAANYSLKSDGKRLRPIITWFMGVREYRLNESAILPLLKSLEYMHTASLIYDDLPSQDNASIRRGRPTVHEMYNTATAELTALLLTQMAVFEQASLQGFSPKKVLHLIQYSSRMTVDMCTGQAMDLDSRGKQLTLEELNTMSLYKTAFGFEASLIMPAILAGADELEMNALKKFAHHAGIAFQIKDDLLDVEGELSTLGKHASKDVENNNSTFVSILGKDGARREMWDHYCLAIEALQERKQDTPFLKHLLNYIVKRDS